jgi:hypothetical protein
MHNLENNPRYLKKQKLIFLIGNILAQRSATLISLGSTGNPDQQLVITGIGDKTHFFFTRSS